MGVRKRNSAEKIKEARKTLYCAKLRNVPSSPRKMRYVADMVRGMEVFKALGVLKFSNKEVVSSHGFPQRPVIDYLHHHISCLIKKLYVVF